MNAMNETVYTPLDPSVRTLENGLRVVCEHLPYVHTASIGVWIRAGSGNEDAAEAGISHFLEHLLFKGTESRTSREVMEAIESRGGQLNAFTTREYTCLYAKVLSAHVTGAVEVLGDIVRHSTFNDLEKERNVILEEIASGKDVPDEHVHDVLTELVWPDHPLGRPIAGYEDTVGTTGLETVRRYCDTWYTPENMVVAIVGRFDEAVFSKQVEDIFGAMPARSVPEISESPVYTAGTCIEDRDIAQDHVVWVFPGVGILDERRYTYDVLSNVLGGGSTSRLFERIREEEGLAYSVYGFNSMYRNGGFLGMYAAVAPENVQHTLDISAEELRRLQDAPPPEDELMSNREQLKGGLMLALESTFNRMTRMVRSLMYFDRIVPVDEVLDAVDAVQASDVQTLAGDVFREDLGALAVLGPVPEHGLTVRL